MSEITVLKPQEALEIARGEQSLQDLIVNGYDLTDEARKNPSYEVELEYDKPDNRAEVLIARQEGKPVGSLVLTFWKDSEEDKLGHPFWEKVRELDPSFPTPREQSDLVLCGAGGVVTDKELRGKGIASELYREAFKKFDPDIIVGQTNTVGAVMLRSNFPGYRTFYGNMEVTKDGANGETTEHVTLLQAYLAAGEKHLLPGSDTLLTYKGSIAPNVPNVADYPDRIKEAFRPVIEEQINNPDITVRAPLISVKSSLLPPKM